MKHRIFIVFIVLFTALTSWAQESVTGVILDSKGKPAKRINMLLKGRMKMTTSSSKGTFELKNVKEGDTLYVYPNRKLMTAVPMLGSPTCTIHLGENSLRYAYESKTIICMYKVIPKPTYNSNIITYEQIQQLDANNLVDLLRGRISGLQIDYSDGKMKATIRGGSSFSLNTEPLFIISGAEYNSLEEANNSVAVKDIREVEVKKDGSEYGMKGANGVIIIRTK